MYRIDDYTKRISLIRGDTMKATVQMYINKYVTYEPHENDVIRFALKETYTSKKTLLSKQIPNDTLILHIAPEDTKDLKLGQYVYDIEITFANGDVDTFISGKFDLLPEVE